MKDPLITEAVDGTFNVLASVENLNSAGCFDCKFRLPETGKINHKIKSFIKCRPGRVVEWDRNGKCRPFSPRIKGSA